MTAECSCKYLMIARGDEVNICIDGFGATNLKGTGHYTYTNNLIKGLLETYPQPQYTLLWNGEDLSEKWKKQKLVCENIEIDRVNNDLRILEEYLTKNKISLFHSPNNGFSIPDKKLCKYVITVHDLIAKTHAELVDEGYKRKFDQVFVNAVQKADKIIAISEFIKWELVSYFDIDAAKIQVIYPWIDKVEAMELSSSRELLIRKYNISFDYILSVGSIHPRKNLFSLVKAFKESELFREGFKLILAGDKNGKRHNYYLQLKAFVDKLGMKDSVIFLGKVDYEDVQHLYKCARCMITMSEYEGFPQVLLEAMSIGVPVICGRNSSFEEVVGKAGHYVDIKDAAQIIKTLRKVTLYESEDKIEEGFIQSGRFEKNESLKKIVSVYENLVY